MSPLPHLFSPFRLGNVTLKNRLVMAPMALNYSTEKGEVQQRQIDYYLERARGESGSSSRSRTISARRAGASGIAWACTPTTWCRSTGCW